jgi:hypothetical protein
MFFSKKIMFIEGRCSTAQIAIAWKKWLIQKCQLLDACQAVDIKNYFCSNEVNPWINLFFKMFWAVSQLGKKWIIAQITTVWINQNCRTCVAVKSWTYAAGKSCMVYMCGSKKHVWYTCVAAKNKCGSKVMNIG